jgi:hypothetical protein
MSRTALSESESESESESRSESESESESRSESEDDDEEEEDRIGFEPSPSTAEGTAILHLADNPELSDRSDDVRGLASHVCFLDLCPSTHLEVVEAPMGWASV